MRLRIISPVRQDFLGPLLWSSFAAFDRRDFFNQGKQWGDVVAVGSSHDYGQRQASRVHQDVVFGSKLAPIHWIGACFRASARRPHRGAVRRRALPANLPFPLQFLQDDLAQTKPNPFPGSNHFTVPAVSHGASGRAAASRGGRGPRRAGSGSAVLVSTLMISLTC